MGSLIGMSLGDTCGCVAASTSNGVTVIPGADGSRTLPALVGFVDAATPLVGDLARRQAIVNAANTEYGVRRRLGQGLEGGDPRLPGSTEPLGVLPSRGGPGRPPAGGRPRPAEDLAALLLGQLREAVARYCGGPVGRAVVGVPTWFTPPQRDALRRAAGRAGLDEVTLVPEPIAAVRAYEAAVRPDSGPTARRRRVAVYDLGGSSFCCSVVESEGDRLAVVASVPDLRLGGRDFDERLVDYFAGRFLADGVHDLRTEPQSLQRLWEAAEMVKRELSSALSSSLDLPYIAADTHGPRHVAAHLSRGRLDALVDDLIERSLRSCQAALDQAGLLVEQIDDLVFVGGQTRMPRLRERVGEFFGRTDEAGLAPDEVVAIGAAHHAIRSGEAALAAQSGPPTVSLRAPVVAVASAPPPAAELPPVDTAAAPVAALPPAAFLPPDDGVEHGTFASDPVIVEAAFDPARVAAADGQLELATPRVPPTPAAPQPGRARPGAATGIWTPPTPRRLPRPRPAGARYLLLGAALVAALAVVAAITLRPRHPAPALPMLIPAAAASASVAIMLEVQPQHATVALDGAPQSLPLPLLPRDGRIHSLRVTAPGYRPAEVPFTADEVQLVRVVLERAAE
jgi:actin-like ATPase involved in cell morphogenesis